MAIVGASEYDHSTVHQITSIDTWVPVLTLDKSKFPNPQAAQDLYVVAWCSYGNIILGGATPNRALMQLGLGDSTGIVRLTAWSTLNNPVYTIEAGSPPVRGEPAFFVHHRDVPEAADRHLVQHPGHACGGGQ